ncbi:hypothetical protein J7E81_08895 [Bacillus sp. ISL-18]|uniref:hypothetical protein n=1 Tax=Bacillus sp. ISL-18 TaxID=2819118 RepID=UPI001BE6EDAA|nr:hypothetical protein [Bacillus sp. ISL-18]MBT2655353.1 hypothetical protein [Bacillus sp. ISL-18]
MAVWQIQFFIVKGSNLTTEKRKPEDILIWGDTPLDGNSLLKLSKLLHRKKSWSDEIVLYGNEEESCLELFYEETVLSEISCRIDVRNVTIKILKGIIDFIVINNAKIFINNVYYPPTLENLVLIIKNSDAYKFCEDPSKFLDQRA